MVFIFSLKALDMRQKLIYVKSQNQWLVEYSSVSLLMVNQNMWLWILKQLISVSNCLNKLAISRYYVDLC